MARSLATPAPRGLRLDGAGVAAAVVMALLLAALAGPVAAVLVAALSTPPPARLLPAALGTLAVALAAALAALVLGALVAYALARVDVPGRRAAWRLLRAGLVVPPFVVPLALLVLGVPGGLPAVGAAQALAFLPLAAALVLRALVAVPVELEQAAEVLGAGRLTVLRRVTLRLAGPQARAAALTVLGLCLADVTAPLLLAGGAVLLPALVLPGAGTPAPAALTLAVLGVAAALAGAGPGAGVLALPGWSSLPSLDRRPSGAARWWLGAAAWLVLLGLASVWILVPLGSLLRTPAGAPALQHWRTLASGSVAPALGRSLALAAGLALAATALALAGAWAASRARAPLAGALDRLARLPVAVPGVVAGAGCLLALGPPAPTAALAILVPLLAGWLLPITLPAARHALAAADRAQREAAVSLGAGPLVTVRRITGPALRPAAVRMLAASFAAGLVTVGAVAGLLGPGGLGATLLLGLAASGATGAACAVASTLVALATAALRLGRIAAGGERLPTPLG